MTFRVRRERQPRVETPSNKWNFFDFSRSHHVENGSKGFLRAIVQEAYRDRLFVAELFFDGENSKENEQEDGVTFEQIIREKFQDADEVLELLQFYQPNIARIDRGLNVFYRALKKRAHKEVLRGMLDEVKRRYTAVCNQIAASKKE